MNNSSIMIMGTSSGCGKSLITTALCRIFHQDGYDTAPFKAQNMSNNAFVTNDGLEIGRAQAVQAIAAGIEPAVHMNPVLLKPTTISGSQAIIHGKPAFVINAESYKTTKDSLREKVKESFVKLSSRYSLIVLEGAGSPAEINLKENDIVNMWMAATADADVLLVGDIDRGGVFASLAGTMLLLDREERKRIKGFIINKFHGDVNLLRSGLDMLEKITGVPVVGVVPYIQHSIDDEDCVTERITRSDKNGDIDICIIKLPHIANLTDFTILDSIKGVSVRYVESAEKIGKPDMLIIPGTKGTIADLREMKRKKITDEIYRYAQNGGVVFGICGGFQILGRVIIDPDEIESEIKEEYGLGLLNMFTEFKKEKVTAQVQGIVNTAGSWVLSGTEDIPVEGYEIHHGQSYYGDTAPVFTSVIDRNGKKIINGLLSLSGNVMGTYIHGIFDNTVLIQKIINNLRINKGLPPITENIESRQYKMESDINRVAATVRSSLNMTIIYNLINRIKEED